MNRNLCNCNTLILMRSPYSHRHKCNGTHDCHNDFFVVLVFGLGFLRFLVLGKNLHFCETLPINQFFELVKLNK